MILAIDCKDPQIIYKVVNYLYVQCAKQIPALTQSLVAEDEPFDCWLSEAGHFVMKIPPDDHGKPQAAAIDLRGYKNPLFPCADLFPVVRAYSLLDTVKYIAEHLYGAPYRDLYAIDTDKVVWKKPLTYKGYLNNLVSMFKNHDDKCLLNDVFKRIENDNPELAIITDVDQDDIKALKERGAYTCYIMKEKLYGGKKQGFDPSLYDSVIDARELKDKFLYECVDDVLKIVRNSNRPEDQVEE